jgi:hypothetical protein
MKIENTEVFGFRAALRAQRNPMDSWDRSDSIFRTAEASEFAGGNFIHCPEFSLIGPKDLELLTKLTKGGTEHRKAIRLIQVWATFDVSRYWWIEADTYKVGLTRVSCSTMHKLGTRPLTQEDFAYPILPEMLDLLNELGVSFRETKDYKLVKKMKNNLPEGYLQRADINLNYETAINIFRQRKNHRLDEWKFTNHADNASICNWIYSLPYMPQLLESAGYV